MREETLERLAPVLCLLRSYSVLREVREATFHLDGRDFIHFHDDADGLWADVRLRKGRVRRSVGDACAQADLMEDIGTVLDSIERARASHAKKLRRKRFQED